MKTLSSVLSRANFNLHNAREAAKNHIAQTESEVQKSVALALQWLRDVGSIWSLGWDKHVHQLRKCMYDSGGHHYSWEFAENLEREIEIVLNYIRENPELSHGMYDPDVENTTRFYDEYVAFKERKITFSWLHPMVKWVIKNFFWELNKTWKKPEEITFESKKKWDRIWYTDELIYLDGQDNFHYEVAIFLKKIFPSSH